MSVITLNSLILLLRSHFNRSHFHFGHVIRNGDPTACILRHHFFTKFFSTWTCTFSSFLLFYHSCLRLGRSSTRQLFAGITTVLWFWEPPLPASLLFEYRITEHAISLLYLKSKVGKGGYPRIRVLHFCLREDSFTITSSCMHTVTATVSDWTNPQDYTSIFLNRTRCSDTTVMHFCK